MFIYGISKRVKFQYLRTAMSLKSNPPAEHTYRVNSIKGAKEFHFLSIAVVVALVLLLI